MVASLLLLLLAAPVMAIIALLILVRLGRPVLFRQMRPGLEGRPFTLIKFRTMRLAAPSHGDLSAVASDAERLDGLGRLLRASGLDELPELWNVLRGDMSLVGPRPLLMEYLPLYSPEQSRRHCVRPGITGWAQVHGRNRVGWTERLELDVWYVDHRSFVLDLRILGMTLLQLLRPGDSAQQGHATMEPFRGTASAAPRRQGEVDG
ncbi:MAG: sugar transferase [Phycisphaeraceae bacterium]|nr:sugar transferase [Phycisphaeraceae bacterium]